MRKCRGCEQDLAEGQFTLGASLCDDCAAKRYQKEKDDEAWRTRPHDRHQWKFVIDYEHSAKGVLYACADNRCGYNLNRVIYSPYSEPGYYIDTLADWYLANEEKANIMEPGEKIR